MKKNALEEILPSDTLKVGFAFDCLNGPEGNGNANKVETSTGNLSNVSLGLSWSICKSELKRET